MVNAKAKVLDESAIVAINDLGPSGETWTLNTPSFSDGRPLSPHSERSHLHRPENSMTIDAHHHFWKYSAAEYGWITPEMQVIRRDFLPEDLEPLMHHFGIEGTVAVQARQTLEETTWLLGLAEKHPLIRGVVGWVPLTDGAGVKRSLERFAGNQRLRGVRHVVQDEPDPRYILRKDFNEGVSALHEFGLRYDILIFERHLPAAIEFVDRHPNQTFILDHIAKPRIKDKIISPWDRNMRELAKRQNVYCKLSGMVTEADPQHWTPEGLAAVYRRGARGLRTAPRHVRIGLAGDAAGRRLRALVRHGEAIAIASCRRRNRIGLWVERRRKLTGFDSDPAYISLRYSWTNWTDIAPSPTAEATRFTDPERTSPAANTPGWLVSSRNGGRATPQ